MTLYMSVGPWARTLCAQCTYVCQLLAYTGMPISVLAEDAGASVYGCVQVEGGRECACDVCGCERLCWQMWEHLGCCAGRPWCDFLMESPDWLVVCRSWCVCVIIARLAQVATLTLVCPCWPVDSK